MDIEKSWKVYKKMYIYYYFTLAEIAYTDRHSSLQDRWEVTLKGLWILYLRNIHIPNDHLQISVECNTHIHGLLSLKLIQPKK